MTVAVHTPRVLIVDSSEDTQQVLSAALTQRGVQSLAAQNASEGLKHACDSAPDLVVLDVDCLTDQPEQADFADATQHLGTRLIVLGAMRQQREKFATGSFVAKPYHYGPLIRTIESLLARQSD